jgi:glycogen debranching enzyme
LSPKPEPSVEIDSGAIICRNHQLAERTFLLGDSSGFTLYLPAARGKSERFAHATKWFGASGFGRAFLEGIRTTVQVDEVRYTLSRSTQTELCATLEDMSRIHDIDGNRITERCFLPEGMQTVVYTLETELPWTIEPEFDMRYYQGINTGTSNYEANASNGLLSVTNIVSGAGERQVDLPFAATVGADRMVSLHLIEPGKRFVERTYLKDEHRAKLIVSAYRETQDKSPDNAPIWDVFQDSVYMPARFSGQGSVHTVLAFGSKIQETTKAFTHVKRHLPQLRKQRRREHTRRLEEAAFSTGVREVDTAYEHVLTRFDSALVIRDATVHMDPIDEEHYFAIMAGNKYFLDAWKRDENICLGALSVTNEYKTMRAILNLTWQHQDEETGRLPQIIQVGEKLVYFSSDGTLWALRRLMDYTRLTNDSSLLESKASMVRRFFEASIRSNKRGLLPSGGVIKPSFLWETWMDTPYTPRAGFPVEIEILWLTVLREYEHFIRSFDRHLADRMRETREEGEESFGLFELDGYLVDSISYQWEPDTRLTPNGYIAFAIEFPLKPSLKASMVKLAREELAGHTGVRSLAPRDWSRTFPSEFLKDPAHVQGRDMVSVGIYNYHRGIEWNWLNPYFVTAELEAGDIDAAYELYVADQVHAAVYETAVGGLSELTDAHGQVGADFQAWSMAGLIESLHAFSGVEANERERRLRIAPLLPTTWPFLECRRRIAECWFDLRYVRSADAQELTITFIDGIPNGSFEVGLPISYSDTALASSINDKHVAPECWNFDDAHRRRAWIRVEPEKQVRIRVETA